MVIAEGRLQRWLRRLRTNGYGNLHLVVDVGAYCPFVESEQHGFAECFITSYLEVMDCPERLIAFEPSPRNFESTRRVLSRSACHVELHQLALGNETALSAQRTANDAKSLAAQNREMLTEAKSAAQEAGQNARNTEEHLETLANDVATLANGLAV